MLIRIPPRGALGACFINTSYIVSMYHIEETVYIELRRTTIGITYESQDDASIALSRFVMAITGSLVDTSEPRPINGSIRINRTE